MLASTPRTGPPASPRRWAALGIVLSAAFMDNVDATILSIALPHIQNDLGADHTTAQWSLAGYVLAFALLLITGGRLGDAFGRRRLFLIGVAGFTAASVACGAATTPEMLIGGRLAQGAMAALMVPQVMSVIVTMFGPAERASAFSLLGAVLSVGSVSGPLLGGLLTEYDALGLGWRAIFYVNVPIGILAFGLAVWIMPETRSDRPLRLDLVGVALVTPTTLGIMYPLVQGRAEGWPTWMFVAMAAAVVLLMLFVAQQRRRHRRDGSALVPPTLFRQRSFTVGVVVVLLVFSGVTSFFLVLTYHLQSGLGWTPLHTALVTLAWPVGITATTHLALRHGAAHGRSAHRHGRAHHGRGHPRRDRLHADLGWPDLAARRGRRTGHRFRHGTVRADPHHRGARRRSRRRRRCRFRRRQHRHTARYRRRNSDRRSCLLRSRLHRDRRPRGPVQLGDRDDALVQRRRLRPGRTAESAASRFPEMTWKGRDHHSWKEPDRPAGREPRGPGRSAGRS
ncbi:MFS transporter [Streptosporangium lutulentum]